MGARRYHGYTAGVWLAAGLVHVGVFLLWRGGDARAPASSTKDVPALSAAVSPVDLASVALVQLPSQAAQYSGAELAAIVGASDQVGADPNEALQDFVDAPGTSAGKRATGVGGIESFAARTDRDTRSASAWNSRGPTLVPHAGEVRPGNTSSESLERAPTQSYSDQAKREKKAQTASDQEVAGLAMSEGRGGVPGDKGEEWLAADPRFDSAPRAQSQSVAGAVVPNRESARVELGARSTEHAKDGPVTESKQSPDRSNRADESPFHLGAPSLGKGPTTGAQGTRGKSNASNLGSGSASQSGQGSGTALASTRASRSHPYFNEMYRRIDKELRFPKKLALALEQGDLVLSFKLDKKGRIRSLKVNKGSGFAAFDAEAVRAFKAAAPFGEVPGALLGTRDRVAVLAPYYFRNPLIR